MIWVSWRQHRSQAIACLGVLAGLAIYAIMVGSSMRTAFGNDGLIGCLAHSQGTACPNAVGAFTGEFGSEVNIAFWSVALIVPGLIGVLVGGSLIARELEYGTWRLAWSQTVSRARWLAVKLGLVSGGLVVLGAAMTAVITWYRAPMDRLTGRFLHNIYDFEGLVPTAYILCAFGFAVLAGLLLRRSVPAMIAAFIPWLAIRLVVEFLVRPNFEAPVTVPCSAIAGACFGHGNGGSGISAIPPATGHIGDWVLNPSAGPAGNLIAYQRPAGSGPSSSSRPASSWPSPPPRSASRSGCCTGAPAGRPYLPPTPHLPPMPHLPPTPPGHQPPGCSGRRQDLQQFVFAAPFPGAAVFAGQGCLPVLVAGDRLGE